MPTLADLRDDPATPAGHVAIITAVIAAGAISGGVEVLEVTADDDGENINIITSAGSIHHSPLAAESLDEPPSNDLI